MQEFKSLTPEEGRRMIKSSGVFLLPNWDIADAMVFNTVTKQLSVDEKVKKELRGAKFNEDHVALVIYSMGRGSRANSSQPNDTNMIGNLIVKRVEDTPNEEAIELNVGIANLSLATTLREKKEIFEWQEKYE